MTDKYDIAGVVLNAENEPSIKKTYLRVLVNETDLVKPGDAVSVILVSRGGP